MPNWTSNFIRVRHDNPAMIDKIMATDGTNKGVLDSIIPCPPELNDEDLTTWSHGPEQEARDKKQAEMVRKYGYKSWYDWNVANWGTKWDLCEPTLTRVDDNTVEISAETAWSPPTTAFETMVNELGYEVYAMYRGEGNEFAGIWDNGEDNYYAAFSNSDEARAQLPKELDEMFNISDDMAEWEEEERREEELYRFTVDGVERRKELGMKAEEE